MKIEVKLGKNNNMWKFIVTMMLAFTIAMSIELMREFNQTLAFAFLTLLLADVMLDKDLM